MNEDIKTFQITLCNGSIFTYNGPQYFDESSEPLYYGTVGDSPDKNNMLIKKLMENTINEPNCWGGPESEVTSLATGSSPWTLLQFIEKRKAWVKKQLENLIENEQ